MKQGTSSYSGQVRQRSLKEKLRDLGKFITGSDGRDAHQVAKVQRLIDAENLEGLGLEVGRDVLRMFDLHEAEVSLNLILYQFLSFLLLF